MIETTIKYFFDFFFCIYICQKSQIILNLTMRKTCIITLVLAIITSFLSIRFEGVNYILPLLLLWGYISKTNLKPQLSFISIIISFTISFCIHATSGFVIIFLTFPFLDQDKFMPILSLLSGCIQALITYKLFRIKRLRNGLPFLFSPNFVNSTTPLGLMFVAFTLFVSMDYKYNYLQLFALFTLILTLTFLIYWWQAQITKSYRRRLELREQESLRTEVAELTLLVQKLTEDNERMARITHRDNTLITTLKNATIQYLSTDFKNPAEAIAARDKLISNINVLSQGRATLPDGYHTKTARTFDTGVSLLDAILHEMDIEAIQQNIIFSVHNAVTLSDFVPSDITEDDLVHTVDDLLKNAFKATHTLDRRMVQLQFYKLGKHLVVEVSDNGIPFEIISFMDMGIEKRTTYTDGSGIGLMDIWSTKEKYRATYHIDEYKNPAPFSKKISMTFDKKNRYSIRTWRKDELLKQSRRIDLQVYDDGE